MNGMLFDNEESQIKLWEIFIFSGGDTVFFSLLNALINIIPSVLFSPLFKRFKEESKDFWQHEAKPSINLRSPSHFGVFSKSVECNPQFSPM